MDNDKIFAQLEEYRELLVNKGYNVIYIGLYGSQNYGCSDELSDIDAKAIVSLSLEQIINRTIISTTVETPTGNIDVKDILTFYNTIRKGNFSYCESIDTDYWLGDKHIKKLFHRCRPNLKSIYGAMLEKRAALTHPYPSKLKEISTWGFDPKQLHHIIRLAAILQLADLGTLCSFIHYEDYEDFGQYLLAVKRNAIHCDLEMAINLADTWIEVSKKLIPEDYVYIPLDLSVEVNQYIKQTITQELLKERKK